MFAPGLVGYGRPDHVAITFDDGPDPHSTPAFLEALCRFGWRATFFMLGTMARRAPSLAAEVAAAGHEIAVHGDEHTSMLLRTSGAVRDDILRCRETLASITGVQPEWFRPPFGALSLGALRAASRLELRTVLWTSWGRDWRSEATPSSILTDATTGAIAGGTLLLHDSDSQSAPGSWRATLGALPLLADAFAERALTAGPLRDHEIPRRGKRAQP